MIIECEGCRSKFNLDDRVLKQEGSKVRCSVCKKVFIAYPPEPEFIAGKGSGRMEMEETVALNSLPIIAEREGSPPVVDKDGALNEAPPEPLSMDDLGGEEQTAPPPGEESYGAGEAAENDLRRDKEAVAPRHQKRRTSRALLVILVLIMILIGGSAAVYFFAPDMIPESLTFLKPLQRKDVSDMGVARLSFANVKGGFVKSEKAGQLFVIQGVVTNNYPKSRSFILVKGSLLDEKGQVVRTKLAYAGNVLADEQLKTMSVDEINKQLKNRAGQQNANARVKPEGQIPFSIVIENLPDNLSEFTVEGVSSSPEQQ